MNMSTSQKSPCPIFFKLNCPFRFYPLKPQRNHLHKVSKVVDKFQQYFDTKEPIPLFLRTLGSTKDISPHQAMIKLFRFDKNFQTIATTDLILVG